MARLLSVNRSRSSENLTEVLEHASEKSNSNSNSSSLAVDKRVVLDIGGNAFCTSWKTLADAPRGCYFDSKISSREWTEDKSMKKRFFVDRDSTHFRHILNFLRNGEVDIPESAETQKELIREAKFYKLPLLVQLLEGQRQTDKTSSPSSGTLALAPLQRTLSQETKNQQEMEVKMGKVVSLKQKTKEDVEELAKMLEMSHRLRGSLETEINNLKVVAPRETKRVQLQFFQVAEANRRVESRTAGVTKE